MPGLTGLTNEGCLDYSNRTLINNALAATPGIVATSTNSALAFGSFGTAVTLLPSTAPAGTYRVTIYGVVTTSIVTATSWLFVLGYTDDKSALTPTVCTSSTMTANAVEQGSYTFRSAGTAAITFTPTAASISAGVIAYSVILERLV